MISPAAIREFLNRKLDDHSWMKRLSEAKLDAALNSLIPKPKVEDFKAHQKVGFLLGLSFPQFFFIYDMGLGKTLLSLKLLEYQYLTKTISGLSVVLVPTDSAALSWEDEIKKWAPGIPYKILLGTSAQKWRRLAGFKKGIVVLTYIGYASMVSEIRPVRNRKTGKERNKRVPHPELMQEFSRLVDAVVYDESTNLGNHTSLTYETVKALSFAASVRYGLAGRPFGRDPTMLWPQCFLIDHGASLSPQLGMFRGAFFVQKKLYWGGPNSYEFKLDKKREPDLSRALAHRSLGYKVEECLDLPECIQTVRRVEFPDENEAYYQRITKALIEARGNFREIENAFIKMRQISSGFLGFIDDETGERAQIEFKRNPKLEELMVLLDEVPDGRKVVVWHEYTWTGSRICRELAANKIKHGWLWGGTKAEEWAKLKDRYDNDPEFKVLVINHKKGAFALNLQSGNFDFVMESPVSPISREQMNRRTWRQGQTRTVFQTDLVVRGSVEEKILGFHKTGADLFKALVANPAQVLVF